MSPGRIATWCALGLIGALGVHAARLRFNLSPSIPIGVYSIDRSASHTVRRGSIVLLCLPRSLAAFGRARGYLPRGTCPDGSAPVGKPVVAVGGDTVRAQDGIWRVNEGPRVAARALARDAVGRPLSHISDGTYLAQHGMIWLLATATPRSWDSRYFGAVPAAGVKGVLRPLWVTSSRRSNDVAF